VIVHINSYPGVGKLTIGRALADLIGGKLLDNHSVFNVAFALTEFKSPAFYDTVRAVREIAYQRILDLPNGVPVILTNWYSQDSAWGEENWDRAIRLAKERDCGLNVVILSCLVCRKRMPDAFGRPNVPAAANPRIPRWWVTIAKGDLCLTGAATACFVST
jgi:hypothetical protein